jgi:hypothetical protein
MALPPVYIPTSNRIVKLSIIDTGARISGGNAAMFFEPIVPGFGREGSGSPSYSFLIEHEDVSGFTLRYIFDLSLPKDLDNVTPQTKYLFKLLQWDVRVPKDVKDVLEENGVYGRQIDGIIIRYNSVRSIL